MEQVESSFKNFASLVHLPCANCISFASVFPFIQNLVAKFSETEEKQIPLWNSGIPNTVLLGIPQRDDFCVFNGTTALIILTTNDLLSTLLSSLQKESISSGDLEFLMKFFNSSHDALKLFKEPLTVGKCPLDKVLSHLHKLKTDVCHPTSIKRIGASIKKTLNNLNKQFRSSLKDSDLFEHISKMRNLIISYQVLGIFETASGLSKEFESNEAALISITSSFLALNFDESLQSLKKFEAAIDKSISSVKTTAVLQLFRTEALKDVKNKIQELVQKITSSPVFPLRTQFVLPTYPEIPNEFSPSFVELLSIKSLTEIKSPKNY